MLTTNELHRRQSRAENVNALIKVIAESGRHFFFRDGEVSHFAFSGRGRLLWVTSRNATSMLASTLKLINRFQEGYTLRMLVVHLRDYIMHGTPLREKIFGPWPADYCHGDLWGYGEDMKKVRETADLLGITTKIQETT